MNFKVIKEIPSRYELKTDKDYFGITLPTVCRTLMSDEGRVVKKGYCVLTVEGLEWIL